MALSRSLLKQIVHKTVKLPIAARFSSYLSSEKVHPLEEYPEVEVIKNPPEWKYVERLLPKKVVPKIEPKDEYHSGWKPPSVGLHNIDKYEYYVARSKNHMIPVYLEITFRGQRRVTAVKHIHGNIWRLEKELRQLVENARSGRLCATRVNEMSGQIRIHGDYVDVVREYLKSKGY